MVKKKITKKLVKDLTETLIKVLGPKPDWNAVYEMSLVITDTVEDVLRTS